MVFTQRPLSVGESFGHERRLASVTFYSDGDSGTPSLFVQPAIRWYTVRSTNIVRFVVVGCRKNLPLGDHEFLRSRYPTDFVIMATFLYLFKNDIRADSDDGGLTLWAAFIDELRQGRHFVGGGALGDGCIRQRKTTRDEISDRLAGYMVITAESLQEANALLDQCPTIRGGGSVEIRRVPEA